MTTSTYRYLVVGGGMTGDAVCQGIREADADGAICLVGEEQHAPYKRPPLTKGLWKGGSEETIWRNTADRGVDLRLGRRIVSIDLGAGRAVDDAGDEYAYERLVLATGGLPRRIGDGEVVFFRTLDDYRRVRNLSDAGARFVVVGGGFIGSEIAAALRSQGREVTIVFPEPGIGWRTFPAHLSAAVTDYYREQGVEVVPGALVASVDEGRRVVLADGRVLEADAVVAGLGIEPRVDLAQAAGLPVDDGIVVDDRARVVGYENVFAAGDVARFPIAALGERGRVEHEDHANNHGRTAGINAAGGDVAYDRLPFFYSDLFDLGYEAVGAVDSRLATVEAWTEPDRTGVVAFVDDRSRPRGFLLWNVWDKVDAARELIAAAEPVDEETVRGLAG